MPAFVSRSRPFAASGCPTRRAVRSNGAATDVKKTLIGLQTLEDLPLVDGEAPLHMMLEYFKPEFEMEPLFNDLGGHFMIHLGPAGGLNLAIRDPNEVQKVLGDPKTFAMDWPPSIQKLVFQYGHSLSDAEAKPWRAAMVRALSNEAVLSLHVPLMVEQFQALIRGKAQGGQEILWRTEAKRMAFTVACRALLGDRITDADIEHLLPCERAMSEGFFDTDAGLEEGVPDSKYWHGIQGRKEIIRVMSYKMEEVLDDRAELEASDTVIGRLLVLLAEEGVLSPDVPKAELADRMAREILFLQFAGTDTTAYSMTRAAVWLAQYPEWHQALWEEQQRLMAEYGDVIDRRVLSRSNVALAMAQESMRVRPSVKVVHRKATKDTTVGNVQVPAGTSIAVAIGACTMCTGNGSPDLDPAQWLSEDHSKVMPNKDPGFTVFGAGPRSCTGRNLAMTELMLTLILLARETSEVEMTEEEIHRPFITVNHPTNCPLKLVPRV